VQKIVIEKNTDFVVEDTCLFIVQWKTPVDNDVTFRMFCVADENGRR